TSRTDESRRPGSLFEVRQLQGGCMHLFLSLLAAAVLVAAVPHTAAAQQKSGGRAPAKAAVPAGPVNINTASAADLESLPGIGATRYLSAQLQQARMEAVARSANVGLKFVQSANRYSYTTYIDGNGNGLRTPEILAGIDRLVRPAERLPDLFYGVDFGTLPGLPPVESGGSPPGADPVKLGAANILTFTPIGTSSSGSLYVLGRSGTQYVIRIFGESGKT